MKRTIQLLLLVHLLGGSVTAQTDDRSKSSSEEKTLGIYIHQHWSYNHPYAARTWNLEDWNGYLDGVRRLGYNSVLIWPMLETMPNPLTPSDRANLDKISKVIDLAKHTYKMRVSIVFCPNVSPKSEVARKYTFEQRPFFYTDDRVDPGDPIAFGKLMAWREELFKPLANADGLFIIDSDPGGYPNSTNMEFVYLLGAHRRMLDRLRPGIEINYWAHFGWESYGKFYATGDLKPGPPEEVNEAISLLAKQNYEPWGVASSGFGPRFADVIGMGDRVLAFNYGAIEGEPSFPFTIYGGDRAYNGGKNAGQRGVMGNAQTHCLQLPNTFAFARGAQGLTVEKADYIAFADQLIVGKGEIIVEAWEALQGDNSKRMDKVAKKLLALNHESLTPGPLKGLLFGDGSRFIADLAAQLNVAAAMHRFNEAMNDQPTNKPRVKTSLHEFVTAVEAWQQRHGYRNHWHWQTMTDALRKLNSKQLNDTLNTLTWVSEEGDTPFERVKKGMARLEDYTPRLIKSMKLAVQEIR